ncbi:MAG TPA: tRNA lysidine(34) synthetase TilS, partial [Acidobacteriota bacterium]|nr:tRNA lysidine(34) synthetase TilS [Acidobacteriota bacterium]
MKMPKLLPLETETERTLVKYNMLLRGDSVVVAVSGGADSMALLHCLHRLTPRWDLKLCAAHLNHRLRGRESDQDAEFVGSACRELGIPLHSEVAEVGQEAAARKRNLEEMAREIRYEFLRRVARRSGAQKIALGHTLNDQAETVLIRFLRGSGSEGLSAIHPVVDGVIVRPLLGCSRDKILKYLKIRGLCFREDSSNRDLAIRRNRVRHELIPYLEEHFNPRLIETLAASAELAREVAGYLESQATSVFGSLQNQENRGVAVQVERLRELPRALQKSVVRLAIRTCRGNLR